ncbi:F-box protein [Endozoicomonas ascidiicola]|uniref:F-box protein n=1 Tax=Endozoicomonas ascidiicola TaxID=1698521 RepID=UPI0008335C78|nr:F-box protein [Endozoicomonas ascidiicola]
MNNNGVSSSGVNSVISPLNNNGSSELLKTGSFNGCLVSPVAETPNQIQGKDSEASTIDFFSRPRLFLSKNLPGAMSYLPEEILMRIGLNLSDNELENAKFVCQSWNASMEHLIQNRKMITNLLDDELFRLLHEKKFKTASQEVELYPGQLCIPLLETRSKINAAERLSATLIKTLSIPKVTSEDIKYRHATSKSGDVIRTFRQGSGGAIQKINIYQPETDQWFCVESRTAVGYTSLNGRYISRFDNATKTVEFSRIEDNGNIQPVVLTLSRDDYLKSVQVSFSRDIGIVAIERRNNIEIYQHSPGKVWKCVFDIKFGTIYGFHFSPFGNLMFIDHDHTWSFYTPNKSGAWSKAGNITMPRIADEMKMIFSEDCHQVMILSPYNHIGPALSYFRRNGNDWEKILIPGTLGNDNGIKDVHFDRAGNNLAIVRSWVFDDKSNIWFLRREYEGEWTSSGSIEMKGSVHDWNLQFSPDGKMGVIYSENNGKEIVIAGHSDEKGWFEKGRFDLKELYGEKFFYGNYAKVSISPCNSLIRVIPPKPDLPQTIWQLQSDEHQGITGSMESSL